MEYTTLGLDIKLFISLNPYKKSEVCCHSHTFAIAQTDAYRH